MKSLVIFVTVFFSVNLYGGLDVPRFFSPDITMEKDMGLFGNIIMKQDSKLMYELKFNFTNAYREYKSAFTPLIFKKGEVLYSEEKPSFLDRQKFMISVIKQLSLLGFKLKEMYENGENILYFWFKTNKLSSQESESLSQNFVDELRRTLFEMRKHGSEIRVHQGILYVVDEPGVLWNLGI